MSIIGRTITYHNWNREEYTGVVIDKVLVIGNEHISRLGGHYKEDHYCSVSAYLVQLDGYTNIVTVEASKIKSVKPISEGEIVQSPR